MIGTVRVTRPARSTAPSSSSTTKRTGSICRPMLGLEGVKVSAPPSAASCHTPWSGTVTRLPSESTVEPAGSCTSSRRSAPSAGTSPVTSTRIGSPAEPWAVISSRSSASGVSTTGRERVS